jgi:hypothetical protein
MRTPASHTDTIHSIILCFSESEPYLNFLSLADVESIRVKIAEGSKIDIEPEVFKAAEEAFSAVKSKSGPKFIQGLASISTPILTLVLLIFVLTTFFY